MEEKRTVTGEPILSIENLHVVYQSERQTVCAVNGIDLEIGAKETIGLVGETGAGKSTTALAIMRLLPERTGKVTEGCIKYCGTDLASLSKKEMQLIRGEKISMIFQDPMTSLNPIMTVGDQILESLRIHNHQNRSKEELDHRVEELLTLVGIAPQRKNDFPHQFSGGMKQRIVIAIALACEPKLVIADEPTTALDVTIQAQVLLLLDELKQKFGTSMIIITHDLGIVAETCDKVAVMYAGEIVEFGTVEDIFEKKEHHPYTEGLFAAIPNLDSESSRLTPIEGLMPDPTMLPDGCKFHPRCKYATERCRTETPRKYENEGHCICCHRFSEEGGK